jgi:hypothetical protein
MASHRFNIRDLGYTPGQLRAGPSNSILDILGLHTSQVTVPTSSNLPTNSTATKGVTVISPRPPNEYYKPCAAGRFTFNGNGEMTGSHQIADWGFINTPVALTNSLSLGSVFDGVWDCILEQQERLGWEGVMRSRQYGSPVVAETVNSCSMSFFAFQNEVLTPGILGRLDHQVRFCAQPTGQTRYPQSLRQPPFKGRRRRGARRPARRRNRYDVPWLCRRDRNRYPDCRRWRRQSKRVYARRPLPNQLRRPVRASHRRCACW